MIVSNLVCLCTNLRYLLSSQNHHLFFSMLSNNENGLFLFHFVFTFMKWIFNIYFNVVSHGIAT